MKRKKELLVVLASLLVIVLSVTFAYFAVQIVGEGKELSLNTANLRITYEDSDGSLSGINITPPWSSSKTFKVTNKSDSTYEYDIIIGDLVNTFVLDYLEYKITSSNGGYNMTEYKPVPKSASAKDTVLVNKVSIDEGEVHNYTIEFRYQDADVDQSADMGKTLSGRIMIQEGTELAGTFMTQLLADNPTLLTRTDFSNVLSTENTGTLYTTNKTEDGSSVYYFAGNAKNNWVKLATTKTRSTCTIDGTEYDKYMDDEDVYHYFTSEEECVNAVICDEQVMMSQEECDNYGGEVTASGGTFNAGVEADALWRIIRTNEDGSIRLLYTGTGAGDSSYSIYGAGMYGAGDHSDASYMWGGNDEEDLLWDRGNGNDSDFKEKVDNFYQNIIGETYDKYVSRTAIYCNDRALVDGTLDPYEAKFGIAERMDSNSPSYKCGANTTGGLYESVQAVEDKFSASTSSGGNGDLTYPAALMTADEVMFAGGIWQKIPTQWTTLARPWYGLGKNDIEEKETWWLMSTYESYFIFAVYGGMITTSDTTVYEGIRPVISLKSCVNWVSGDGSETSPYVVSVSDACAVAEN